VKQPVGVSCVVTNSNVGGRRQYPNGWYRFREPVDSRSDSDYHCYCCFGGDGSVPTEW